MLQAVATRKATTVTLPEEPKLATAPTPPLPRRGPGRLFYSALAVAVLLSAALGVAAIRLHSEQSVSSPLRTSGIPPSVPTSLANTMSLSPVPSRVAPNFKLTDQSGRTFSMSGFKGRAVVLEFMDPHCVDICPLVSTEFIEAYHDLGAIASKIVFMAVNVNQYFSSVASVAKFSSENQLNTIPSWHFFTGSTLDLKTVWRNYGVTVELPNSKADIVHTSVIYFIDGQGHERYVATPEADHTSNGASYLPTASLTAWGRGIALVAKSLIR